MFDSSFIEEFLLKSVWKGFLFVFILLLILLLFVIEFFLLSNGKSSTEKLSDNLLLWIDFGLFERFEKILLLLL